MNIGSFIHCDSIYLHPGVGLEWYLLRSQHHPRRNAVSPEQICHGEGALETESLLWIPHTTIVDCCTDPTNGVCAAGFVGNFPSFYGRVKSFEIAKSVQDVEKQ